MKERPRERLSLNAYTEVTESVRLSPDREFYQQYPFEWILKAAAKPYENTSIDPAVVQSDLSYLVGYVLFSVGKQSRNIYFDREKVISGLLGEDSKLHKKLPVERGRKYLGLDDKRVTTSIRNVFSELNEYPDWQEYVSTKRDTGIYRMDGTLSPAYGRSKIRTEDFPPTYLEWVTTNRHLSAQINELIITGTIAETFPQQTTTSASESTAIARRTWRIKNAKGITDNHPMIRRLAKP